MIPELAYIYTNIDTEEAIGYNWYTHFPFQNSMKEAGFSQSN